MTADRSAERQKVGDTGDKVPRTYRFGPGTIDVKKRGKRNPKIRLDKDKNGQPLPGAKRSNFLFLLLFSKKSRRNQFST
jgi:hypothetical protein